MVGIWKCKVSSVLNGDNKQYGRMNMLDGNDETCWNSDCLSNASSSVQYIVCWLGDGDECKSEDIGSLSLMFQGGFASKSISISYCASNDQGKYNQQIRYNITDCNGMQTIPIMMKDVCKLRISFEEPSDFFGRITIYHLQINPM